MVENPNGQTNIQKSFDNNIKTPPSTDEDVKKGKSVGYSLLANKKYWFPIRATHHRAQQVYDALVALNSCDIEPYLPVVPHIDYVNDDFKNPTQIISNQPLDNGLLFMRSTVKTFQELIRQSASIPGLTPYYNHFFVNEFGRNDYLIVPDRQMESFKIIVDSGSQHILTDQSQTPKFLTGDRVVVIGGPFAGVEGIVLRYKQQRRVFVELIGVGSFGTGYIPKNWIRKIGE